MSQINSNLPRFIFNGVQDLSTRVPAPPVQVEPQHFPLFFIQSPKGNDIGLNNVINYNDAVAQLGLDTFDVRKPYFNHQTLGLQLALENGNACFVKRITTPGAGAVSLSKATAVLIATIETGVAINEYQRDVSGNVLHDLNNSPLFVDDSGSPVPITGGIKVKYSVVPIGAMSISSLSSPIVIGGATSYPLLLLEGPFNGTEGNKFGFKIWAGTANNQLAGDPAIVADQEALIFNAQIIQNVGTSTPQTVIGIDGDPYTTFMFKPNAFNKNTNQDLTIQNLVTLWTNDGFSAGTSPTYGPIGSVTVFENNLTTFLGLLLAAETLSNPNPPTSIWMLDFLTATSEDGIAAYGFQIDTTGDVLSANNSFYLSGGTDGSLLNSDYELAIQNWTLTGYDTEQCPAANILKYPFSYIYDTGFTNPTKDILPMWMGYRENTSVHLSTYIDGTPPLLHAAEISAASVLQQQMLNQAESNVFGTPAFRGTLVLQSGYLTNGYKKPVSAIYELLIKRCIMMGAGNGIMSSNTANDYTLPVNNQIQNFKSMSSPNFTAASASEAWNNGAIFTVPCGMGEQYFYPYIHTVYPNDTSILTSDIIRHICGHIALIQAKLWVALVGRDDLTTNELFIAESDKLFKSLTANIFAGKATLTPTTYFTPNDIADGYRWTQSVEVSANTTKDVATFNVVTTRIKS